MKWLFSAGYSLAPCCVWSCSSHTSTANWDWLSVLTPQNPLHLKTKGLFVLSPTLWHAALINECGEKSWDQSVSPCCLLSWANPEGIPSAGINFVGDRSDTLKDKWFASAPMWAYSTIIQIYRLLMSWWRWSLILMRATPLHRGALSQVTAKKINNWASC